MQKIDKAKLEQKEIKLKRKAYLERKKATTDKTKNLNINVGET